MAGIIVVKGISGSGKSSRVFQLIKYFESIGLNKTDIVFTDDSGKKKTVGFSFEEAGIAFIGKIYVKNGVEKWQGYDAMTSSFGSAENFSLFLSEHISKYAIVVEGAGLANTFRLRPKYLAEEVGAKDILIKYYNYDEAGKADYLSRIVYRSGEEPKKDAMWSNNMSYVREFSKSVAESKTIPSYVHCQIIDGLFSDPISDLGNHVLKFIGLEDEIPSFESFVKELDYININKFQSQCAE